MIGAGGEQGGFDQELLRLGPELLDRYGKGFRRSLERCPRQTEVQAAGGGQAGLSCALGRRVPDIADHSAFRGDRAGNRIDARAPGPGDAETTEDRAKGLARIGIELPTGKSQSRAGAAFAQSAAQNPGGGIEAQFRPFQLLVNGPPGQRPIDALIQNFRDILQSLKLAAAMPTQTERANANLQLQISSLRANASRLPKPLARMVNGGADDFEGDVAETSIAQLNQRLAETVSKPCEDVIGEPLSLRRQAAPTKCNWWTSPNCSRRAA